MEITLSLENKWPAHSLGKLGLCRFKQKAFVTFLSGVSCICLGPPPSLPQRTLTLTRTLPEGTGCRQTFVPDPSGGLEMGLTE